MRRSHSKHWRPLLAPVVAALAVAACTTATPYQPLRGSSGGFAEQRVDQNRYRVSFTGNEYTSRQRVEDYLLYRAAELTLANGYDSFTVVRGETEEDREVSVSPGWGSYSPHWRPHWSYYGRPYGWRHWDPWFGAPYWADGVDIDTVSSYEATAEILMNRGPGVGARSFDARQVIARLGPKIVIPR
jgi:hypothetical protein